STGKAERLGALLKQFHGRLTVFAASDSMALRARQMGADGFISALANIFPRTFRRIWDGASREDDGALASAVVAQDAIDRIHAATTVPKVRWRSRWGQPRWLAFRDPLGQFLIDYPSDWDMSAPFERFTRHRIGNLVAVDTVAFRHAYPTGLVVVISYTAPRSF